MKNIKTNYSKLFPNGDYRNIQGQYDSLERISLDKMKEITKGFFDKNFSLKNIFYLDKQSIMQKQDYISESANAIEFYVDEKTYLN